MVKEQIKIDITNVAHSEIIELTNYLNDNRWSFERVKESD